MAIPKQVRVTPMVSKMVDKLEKKLTKRDVFIKSRQDVVAKAIVDLYKKEFES